jgi:hypothetical protein
MSDAYRGEEEAAQARLASLREELERREAHLAELDVGLPEHHEAIVTSPERARAIIPLSTLLLCASLFAFVRGDRTFGVGALTAAVIVLFMGSPVGLQFRGRFTESLPAHVDEFKDPEPIEPARQMRVPPSSEEEEIRKREIENRRAACSEIEQEIAENLEILSKVENEK